MAAAHAIGRTIACPHCRRPLTLVESTGRTDRLVGQRLGGWKLTGRLGAGAFGVVYRARTEAGRMAAVKLISETAAKRGKILERFQRESELGAQVRHPNVVGTFGFGFERGAHWLATELVDGPNLATLVEEDGPLPWDKAVDIVTQIAQGLEAVHALGIIHRDIKPANILLSSQGVARLADLGLAKQLEPDEGDDPSGLTLAGAPLGSPAFMPPEQVRSAKDATTQADIYALGATLHYLLGGKLPYDGPNPMVVMSRVLTEAPADLPPGLPRGVGRAVALLMDKDPARRPAGAAAARDLLLAVQREPNLAPASRTMASAAGGPSLLKPILIIAGLVVIAVLVIVAALMLA